MRRDDKGRVADLLTNEVDPDRVAAGWERVRARRSRPRAVRRAIVIAPLVAIAAVVVLVIRGWLTPAPAPTAAATAPTTPPTTIAVAPIALAGGAALPFEWRADSAGRAVVLDDGSRLELAPSTEVRTSKSAPDRVELAVGRGSTTFDVKPGGPRTWIVDAGPVVVRVLGTRFTVARTGDDVVVSVERGKVQVESRGVVRVLTAGETFESTSPRTSPTPPRAPEPKTTTTPAAAPVVARETAPTTDAMDRADTERRGGQPRAAVATLRALVDSGDRRAPLAAFTIAKIHAEDLGDPRSAATWFERAITLGLPGGLDEEAHARAVEGYSRSGARAEATRARARYEARFPNGRHLARVREWAASSND